jgi:hypothetical protein
MQMRIYVHGARRAGTKQDGTFWESVPNCARCCGVHEKTARKGIHDLVEMGLWIVILAKPGDTVIYRLAPPVDWKQPLPKNNPSQKVAGVEKGEGSGPAAREGRTPKKREGSGPKIWETKVLPEVSPLKANPEGVEPQSKPSSPDTNIPNSLARSCEGEGEKTLTLKLTSKTVPTNRAKGLEDWCFQLLGKDEMVRCGSRWRERAVSNPTKLEKILAEVKVMLGERKIRTTTAKAAEDLWKRWP